MEPAADRCCRGLWTRCRHWTDRSTGLDLPVLRPGVGVGSLPMADQSSATAEDTDAKRRRVESEAGTQPPDATLLAELVAASSSEAVLEVCRRHGAAKLQQLAGAPVANSTAAPAASSGTTRDGSVGVASKPAPEPAARTDVTFRILVIASRAEKLSNDLSKTGATVTIEPAVAGCDDRVLSCVSAEVPGATWIAAQDAVVAAGKAAFAGANGGEARLSSSFLRLLVPKKQIGSVLGKGGSTITAIRTATKAVIKVQDDALPTCARPLTEEMITITGDEHAVTLAVQRVTGQLRTFQVSGTTSLISGVVAPPGVAASGLLEQAQQHGMQTQATGLLPAASPGNITERLTVDNVHVRLRPRSRPSCGNVLRRRAVRRCCRCLSGRWEAYWAKGEAT